MQNLYINILIFLLMETYLSKNGTSLQDFIRNMYFKCFTLENKAISSPIWEQ